MSIFRLLLMHQAGLINYAIRKLSSTLKNPCFLGGKQKHGGSDGMLKFPEFVGAFFTLGTGLCSAVVALIVELVFNKVCKGRPL